MIDSGLHFKKESRLNNPENTPQQKIADEASAFCRLLNLYFMKKYSYRKEPTSLGVGNNICVQRSRVYLYLRFKAKIAGFMHLNPIVIAAIDFRRSRKGDGTEFLRFLVRQAPQFGIDSIAIECPHSEAIRSFGKKFGFERINQNYLVANICTLQTKLNH